jgi:hypothetical protein
MKKFWQKWSYEIPLAIGDALWEVLVVQFAAFLDRLTFRKVVEFVAIAILVMAFIQTLPIDLAILFAGDTLMYLEFLVAIRLAAGVMHVRAMLHQAMRLARLVLRALNAAVRLPALTLRRLRERRTAAASKPRRISDSSDDDRGLGIAWGALAPA